MLIEMIIADRNRSKERQTSGNWPFRSRSHDRSSRACAARSVHLPIVSDSTNSSLSALNAFEDQVKLGHSKRSVACLGVSLDVKRSVACHGVSFASKRSIACDVQSLLSSGA